MKAVRKSSTTSPAARFTSGKGSFFRKAGESGFFASTAQSAAPAIQAKMAVNKPGDKYEQEADKMADKVIRMPAAASRTLLRQPDNPKQQDEEKIQKAENPEEKLQKQEEEIQKAAEPDDKLQKQEEEIQKAAEPDDKLQKQEEETQKATEPEDELQRKGTAVPSVDPTTQFAIRQKAAGGQKMSPDIRSYMEPRFGADFSNVRIHSDAESAGLSNRLSARAFTYRNHIFFSRGQYQPGTSEGKQLLAHELTHTIQQGQAVQRSQKVTTNSTPPTIQRLGIQDALDYFAERAYHIPGFRMLTILIGFNPINRQTTDRSAANILRALIEFLPGGHLITQALDNHGVFNRAGAWVEQQFATLGDIGSSIRTALDEFLDGLNWRDIFNLGGVWRRARRIFTTPIRRLIAFGRSVVRGIMDLVKDAILRPLARMAEGTRGYDLLKALLGQDPITGDPVPRNAETLIGGFMRLIGQEEIWLNIQRGNAVARAWAWFQGALSGLMGFVRAIPGRIVQTLASITWRDVLTIVGVFAKVGRAFLSIAGQFFSWAGRQVMSLLEIIFSVVAPGAMPWLRRARGAFRSIIRNPIGFVRNLVRAGIQGFRQFSRNFLTHLRASLIGWLTGTLSGANIHIPQAFTLREILKFVLSVLGLTWQNIRRKLVRVVGERPVRAMEGGFALVRRLVTEGPAAAWRQILQGISNLRQMVMEQIMNFVAVRVVQAAITRLVTSLNPAGAFIQAILAIYNTIMFFIERLRQISQVAVAFLNSMMAIAAGNIAAAANRVEQTMAGMLTLVISFLARLAGLGNVSRAVTNIINRVRRPIDRALDRVVTWIVRQARRLGLGIARAGVPQNPNERLTRGMALALRSVRSLSGNRIGRSVIVPVLSGIKLRYGFSVLEPEVRNGKWWIRGVINPSDTQNSGKNAEDDSAPSLPPLTPGTWIRVLATNTYERVRNVSSVIIRGQSGQRPVRFTTVKPDGGAGSHATSREGVEWERTNFAHQSSFVMPSGSGATFVLKDEYRGSENIRPRFYRDTSNSRRQILNQKLSVLQHPSDSSKFLSEGSAADEAAQGYTQTFNGKAVVPRNDASPDHDPPLAAHWTHQDGNNTSQSSRISWNTTLTSYKLISLNLNLHLGSRGDIFTERVGINFRGPGE